jgi:recombinational DNA repair ATPase RecF
MLLDDIYSELDRHNLRKLIESLISLGAQTFLTSIESPTELAELVEKSGKELRMFHVERGKIEAI